MDQKFDKKIKIKSATSTDWPYLELGQFLLQRSKSGAVFFSSDDAVMSHLYVGPVRNMTI